MRYLQDLLAENEKIISDQALKNLAVSGIAIEQYLSTNKIRSLFKAFNLLLIETAENLHAKEHVQHNSCPAIKSKDVLAKTEDIGIIDFLLLCKAYKRSSIHILNEHSSYEKQCAYSMFIDECFDSLEIEKSSVSEKKLEFTSFSLENSGAAVLWLTFDGKIANLNNALSRLYGYTKEELLDLTIFDIDRAIDLNIWQKSWKNIKHNKFTAFEAIHRKKDGTYFQVEILANHLLFDGVEYQCVFLKDITDRKQMEKKLLESEESYRTLSRNLPDIVYRLYPSRGNYMEFFNARIESILGYTTGELQKEREKAFDLLIESRDRAKVKDTLQMAIDRKESFEVLYSIKSKSGKGKYFLERGTPAYDTLGNVNHIDGIIIDETSSRIAEQALISSRRMLRAVLDTIPVRVYWKNKELTYLGCNIHFARDAGLISSEEIIGKDDYVLPWSNEADQVREDDLKVLRTGIPWLNYDVKQRTPSGEIHWLKMSKIPLRDDSNEIIGVLVCYDNITSWKQMEEEKEIFFDVSLDMLCVATLDGYFKQLTPSWTATLGWSKYELMARPYVEFIHPDDVGSTLEVVEILREGQNVLNFDNRYVCKDGSYKWLSWKSYVDIENNVIYAVARDIQERKQMEEELKAKTAELQKAIIAAESASKAKSRFLSSMSHEIRTPLNAIIGFTDIMFDTNLNDEQRQFVTMVKQSGEDLLNLINDILDISKVESGKIELEKTEFNIEKVVAHSCSFFSAKAKDKGIAFSYTIKPGTQPDVIGDQYRLRQILNNLISNAVKFTEKGSIVVTAWQDASFSRKDGSIKIFFSVKDTGIGIPEDKHDLIFDSFTQVDSSVTRKYGGTGLGLRISKQLTEMMGGSISIKSKPGQGSVFMFSVLFDAAEKSEKTEKTVIAAKKNSLQQSEHRSRILIADDSMHNQVVLRAFLKHAPVIIETTDNGKDALKMVTQDQFDLVLMDIQMPEMDGMTATRAIRHWERENMRPPVPIVAITAYVFSEDVQSCRDAGCTDYISKPIDKHLFLQTIARHIPHINYSFGAKGKESNNSIAEKPGKLKIDPVLLEFIPGYLQSVAEQIDKIYESLTKKDFDKISSIGHKMKGDGGTYGIDFISETGKTIQQASLDKNIDKIKSLSKELAVYIDALEFE